jgi:MFS family permease
VLFGALTVWTIVVIRFLFEGTRSDEEHALAALGSVAVAIGIGLVVASIIAPALVRRYGPRTAAVCAMGCAAVGCLVPTASMRLGSMLIAWAMVGAGAQVLKITVDTTLQRSSPDDLRGRVFIAYDLVFNLAFVLGVTIVAAAPLSLLDRVLVPTVCGVGFAMVAIAVQVSSGRQWSA